MNPLTDDWAILILFSMQVKLSDYRGKKYVVLFFYPLDFTFVCPTGILCLPSSLWTEFVNSRCSYTDHVVSVCTEITAFSDRHGEFEKLNTEVIGVSIDSVVCEMSVILEAYLPFSS